MAMNSQINSQVLHSLVNNLMSNYRELKKWLGNAKEVLVVYTKPKSGQIPYSEGIRTVLEEDGKRVDYIDQKDFQKAFRFYGKSLIDEGIKTIIVENEKNEKKGVSLFTANLAKKIVKGSISNFDNVRYVTPKGVLNSDQAHSLYLYHILSRKYGL